MKHNKYEIDMCNGPLLKKILLFSLPLMLSGILQLLFNAADVVIVGRFAGAHALAAVGSTTSLINLLINVFMGLSVGTNVMTARYLGTNDEKGVGELVHTSLLLAFVSGVVLIFIGFFLSEPILSLMGTPDDVLDQAVLYMRVYFTGMPVVMVYNFGYAVFRAIGDTRRPLYYLTIAGILNVVLNILFVTQFNMGVAGVAAATVISQALSSVLLLRALAKTDACYKFVLKKLAIKKKQLFMIIRVGLPAGIQGSLFSISNVLIQSSVNYFGTIVMAGNAAASNIGNFQYTAMNSFYQTAISFVSQNFGAGKFERIKRIAFLCIACVSVTGIVLGIVAFVFGENLLGIYSTEPEVIKFGLIRLSMIGLPYFMAGIMDVLVGCIRGMGYSVVPMIASLIGVCGLRIVWIFSIFQRYKTLEVLYLSYAVTWTVTALCHFIFLLYIYRKNCVLNNNYNK